MDDYQKDHLKAYGIAFYSLKNNANVEWLLNYRGGSFLFDNSNIISRECILRGVNYELISATELNQIYQIINDSNMDIVLLEKTPEIAVYSPEDKQPWDDAVTLALTYAEIDYEIIFDTEVINNEFYEFKINCSN